MSSASILLKRATRCLHCSRSFLHQNYSVLRIQPTASTPAFAPVHRHILSGQSTHRALFSFNASSSANAKQDYYQLLGVSRHATPSEIKKAYYALAKSHHPDRGGDDPGFFAKVNQAYEALSDAKMRKIYDQYGEEGLQAASMGADPGSASGFPGDFSTATGSPDVDEFFRQFSNAFGGNASTRRPKPDQPMRGDNRQCTVTLSLKEAASGTTKQINVKTMESCDSCSGTGKTSSTKTVQCTQCKGQGRMHNSFGVFHAVMDCERCNATGYILTDPCSRCNGDGVTPSTTDVSVSFPAGCDTGMVLRVPRAGDKGKRRGPAGDLFVQIRVRDDPYFHRDGRDLHVVAPISIAQAALGGTVRVKTLDGEEEVKIQAGTQPDDKLSLQGRALRGVKSAKRGDQVIHFKVVVPQSLSERQRQLLSELLELEGGKIETSEDCSPPSLRHRFRQFLQRTISPR